MSECIFCKIVQGEIPSKTLYEDKKFRVILDVRPATRGHALILTKQHFSNVFELPDDSTGEVFILAKRMAGVIQDKLKCDGFNLMQNNGEVAGQTQNHFHMHIIPRYSNDGQEISLATGEPTPEELEAVRQEILC